MKTRLNQGFTLLELMIVVAILGVIAAIAIPAYKGYITTSYKSQCQNEVASIKLAESEYFLEHNAYFSGANVTALQNNSKQIYAASKTALGKNANMPKECDYSVNVNGNTYTISATGTTTAGGHLPANAKIVYFSGP